jgi:hypothetical protein
MAIFIISPIEMAIGTFPVLFSLESSQKSMVGAIGTLVELGSYTFWLYGIVPQIGNHAAKGLLPVTTGVSWHPLIWDLGLKAFGGVGGLLRRLTPTSSMAVLRAFSMCLGQQKGGWGGWKMLERTHFVRVFSDWTWIGSHRKKTFGPYFGYLWSTFFFLLKWDLLHPYVNFHIHIWFPGHSGEWKAASGGPPGQPLVGLRGATTIVGLVKYRDMTSGWEEVFGRLDVTWCWRLLWMWHFYTSFDFFSWDMLGFPRSVKSFKRTSLTSWRPRGDKFPCNSQ